MCILTYGVNFVLLFYTWLISRRFDSQAFFKGLAKDFQTLASRKKLLGGTVAVFSALLVLSWGLIPKYWDFTPPSHGSGVTEGLTEDGHHWIGAENPEITIVEFTDYLCFQCKKMHFHLRSLIDRFPERIRLVHRHYPMDHSINPVVKEPFHEGAAVMSLLAIQAGIKGKFWQTNDALFRMAGTTDKINTGDLADIIGLESKDLVGALKDPKPYNKLRQDIRDGMKLGIMGTPSYVIDGRVYEGQIPADILSKVLSGKTSGVTAKKSE
jgi:protein-disulfide isomerase